MSFLVLTNLQKTYPDGTPAVKGIDLSVKEGEFIVLLGPSGCGKTTTLRMIAGLELATGGSISLGGRDVTQLRPSHRDVGMVFQFYALYPHLSVRENIAFPLKCVGMPKTERENRLGAVARKMGLESLLGLYPKQLSGGDQQRVSLARAMVRRPAVYLMDEPLGTLDSDQRLEMREYIRSQQLAEKVTTLYVTHDQEEAMSLADRIVVMEGGKICQVGSPAEVYDKPSNLFVANFVGSPGMNFLPDPSGKGTLGIRCEYVRPDPNGAIAGKVVMNEYLGSTRSIHVQTESGRIVMRGAADDRRPVGESIRLSFDPAHVCHFKE